MASLKRLDEDECRYQKSYQMFVDRSSEHLTMREFIQNTLPTILTSVGSGKSQLNVIGVGSGAGTIDLEILSQLHLKHPGVLVDNEVVEPNSKQLHNYRVTVNQKPDLDYVKFTWNNMTASEFEEQWKQKKVSKKADLIHMIQMLYHVSDPEATINFFHSLLDKNGKLLISLVTDESGWKPLGEKFYSQLCNNDFNRCLNSGVIKRLLEARGVSYQSYKLQSHMDITECFTEGDQTGELMLDFLTQTLNFSKTATDEFKQEVLKLLRDPTCSEEKEGRVLFNGNMEVIIVDQSSDST